MCMSSFKKLQKIEKEIRDAYGDFNRREGKKVWNLTDYTQGFVGDVGDLLKIIRAGNLDNKKNEARLKHEIGDCLWSIIAISQELGIDPEKEFLINAEYLKQKLFEKIKEKKKGK